MKLDFLRSNPEIAKQLSVSLNGFDLITFAEKLVRDTTKETTRILKGLNKPEELLTRAQVSDILKVSLPTLHHWNKNGTLANLKIGNQVRYRRSDVDPALKERV
ncbi:MAG: helix-turn-helix domain-containing protein [Bacteroidetes bacterium]|nr:helix-turn-helix domain-containing protein [Bacteroidota bacterium]MBL6944312.1 helix-turn-helix domain-containing protein [Bacteroidales bacterium]